jgi:pimeloyl-ACP methyl ester carboxylesterase
MDHENTCRQNNHENERSSWGLLRTTVTVIGATLGALALANAFIAARVGALQSGLPGTFNRFPTRSGDAAYVVAGSGSPVLLLHGIGAGNSMMEWEKNFDALREQHTVYALDLLGWGRSDRPHGPYNSEDYVDLIESFTRNVIGAPCALIASSDSCSYAIEAAQQSPELFSQLILICPSIVPEKTEQSKSESKAILWVFGLPIVGQTLHNFFTSRSAVASFAKHQLYFDKEQVTGALVTRYYNDAHQPGARNGLASFVSGNMRHNALASWSRLQQPALLVWGRNTQINGVETAPEWLALKADAELHVIDNALLLPHVEHSVEWNQVVLEWLRSGASPTDI